MRPPRAVVATAGGGRYGATFHPPKAARLLARLLLVGACILPTVHSSLAPPPPPATAVVQTTTTSTENENRGRELRVTVEGATDDSSGPTYPVFVDDVPLDDAALFAVPAAAVRPDPLANLAVRVPASCDVTQLGACTDEIEDCLVVAPDDHAHVCSCYHTYAVCHRTRGCFDLLTRAEVMYCFETLRCTADECDAGDTVATAAAPPPASLAAGTVAVVVTLAAVLVAPLLQRRAAG